MRGVKRGGVDESSLHRKRHRRAHPSAEEKGVGNVIDGLNETEIAALKIIYKNSKANAGHIREP